MEQITQESIDQLAHILAVADTDLDRVTRQDIVLAQDALTEVQAHIDGLHKVIRELLEGEVTPMARYLAERALEGTLSTSAPAL